MAGNCRSVTGKNDGLGFGTCEKQRRTHLFHKFIVLTKRKPYALARTPRKH